jgi:hypothetical protein
VNEWEWQAQGKLEQAYLFQLFVSQKQKVSLGRQ